MITNKFFYSAIIILLAFFIQGCLDASESDYERHVREADEYLEAYISENNIDAERQNSGVYIEVVQENENGKQVVEDHVAGILYTLRHIEGDYEIETHADSLNPLRFNNSYGVNFHSIYPPGLNYEIGNMRQGETFRFYIPSYRAFEGFSHEDFFDAHSHLMIEAYLVEVKTEEEVYEDELGRIQDYIQQNALDAESYPNGLYYVVLEEGTGATPGATSQVDIHFTRTYLDGTVIESTKDGDPIRVNLNNNELVDGFETGIGLIREGETAKLIMPSKLAFGSSIQMIPQGLREILAEEGEIWPETKPYSPVIYEVELLSIN
jgi:FKBP-type peptidyl-prolyl cis-trans isomerase FkpA